METIQREQESFRKEGPGRPSPSSKYRREITLRFQLKWRIDDESWSAAQVDDAVFPLLTNDRSMTPRELLEAYKRQPKTEKRFMQVKSGLELAPVFLKSAERVVGLFTVYFLALLVYALIERDLRLALGRLAAEAESDARHPTARHALVCWNMEHVCRYELLQVDQGDDTESRCFCTTTSPRPSSGC